MKFAAMCVALALFAAPAVAEEMHGKTDAFSAPGVKLAWAIARGPDEARTFVVVRMRVEKGVEGVVVTGRDPFGGGSKVLASGAPTEVRISRASFADYPRTEWQFTGRQPPRCRSDRSGRRGSGRHLVSCELRLLEKRSIDRYVDRERADDAIERRRTRAPYSGAIRDLQALDRAIFGEALLRHRFSVGAVALVHEQTGRTLRRRSSNAAQASSSHPRLLLRECGIRSATGLLRALRDERDPARRTDLLAFLEEGGFMPAAVLSLRDILAADRRLAVVYNWQNGDSEPRRPLPLEPLAAR
jgi:hypothetical protein